MPPSAMASTVLLLATTGLLQAAAQPPLTISLSPGGWWTLLLDGTPWFSAPASPPVVCIAGASTALKLNSTAPQSGRDAFGAWTGTAVTWLSPGGAALTHVFQVYASLPSAVVMTAAFPLGLNTAGCPGGPGGVSVSFPAIDTAAARADSLGFLQWRDEALKTTATSTGLASLGANALDASPIVSYEMSGPSSGRASIAWSSLTAHKILPHVTSVAAHVYAQGLSASIASVPVGWNYSVVFSASTGGPTAATYALGALLQRFYSTRRLPSVTLDKVGYYTDDGAYYYVWEAFNIPARPWPAQDGLRRVIANLTASGVPVAYLQLDDWWYSGPFYFGNVKAVVDWHASTVSRLFPDGLPSFADALDLPLQLYTPFWDKAFVTTYNMTPSTAFTGTKLVVPKDAYLFFADLFDLGAELTGRRFVLYEIDFLDANFKGSVSMFESVHSADVWYAGMADAAAERNVTIQYCLASATDILTSLSLPAVVQARASPDYVNKVDNAFDIGGSSLFMGALAIAPSKDTLWTASPQPGTMSDTEHGGMSYTTQPHVALDVVLATLSQGPVGISDGLGQQDVGLISQAFMSPSDGTLVRPSRPLSWVDSVFYNRSAAGGAAAASADVRSTHTAIPAARGANASLAAAWHHVVAWRTTAAVHLALADLYPQPPASARLAVRAHVVAPAGPAQQAGCVDGQPAQPGCATLLPAGEGMVVPPTGGQPVDFSLTSIAVELPNGAFFLGELSKVVHVSPQRFAYVVAGAPRVGGAGEAGIVAGVRGSPGQVLLLTAVDPGGVVRVANFSMPQAGFLEVGL